MLFSSAKIEKLTALPDVVVPNQFYLIETVDDVSFYISDSKSNLILLNEFGSLFTAGPNQVLYSDGISLLGNVDFTFVSGLLSVDRVEVDPDPYSDAWLDNNEVPTKNDIYRNFVTGLFSKFNTVTTTGLTQENLYTYELPIARFLEDGHVIEGGYSGHTAANTNNKRIFPKFAETVLATGQTTANDQDWTVDFYLIRKDVNTVRYGVEFTVTGDPPTIAQGEIGSLDLDTTAYLIDLDARTISQAGDINVTSGYAKYIPVPSDITYLEFDGESLFFGSEPLTFDP